MSEYQYYEFVALDRPLSPKDVDEVRKFSSRAEISSTRFVNEYNYGDFRGKPETFLTRWFDVMLHLANWGTHQFMCKVPADLIDVDYATECCAGSKAEMTRTPDGQLIFNFSDMPDDGGDEDDYDGSGRLTSLLPIRAELLAGDPRPLYLGWLHNVQSGDVADDAIEPAVPPGLKKLSGAQIAFADFLRLDEDLLTIAAANSPEVPSHPRGFEDWLRRLPTKEKDALLLALVDPTDPHSGARLRRRFGSESAQPAPNLLSNSVRLLLR